MKRFLTFTALGLAALLVAGAGASARCPIGVYSTPPGMVRAEADPTQAVRGYWKCVGKYPSSQAAYEAAERLKDRWDKVKIVHNGRYWYVYVYRD